MAENTAQSIGILAAGLSKKVSSSRGPCLDITKIPVAKNKKKAITSPTDHLPKRVFGIRAVLPCIHHDILDQNIEPLTPPSFYASDSLFAFATSPNLVLFIKTGVKIRTLRGFSAHVSMDYSPFIGHNQNHLPDPYCLRFNPLPWESQAFAELRIASLITPKFRTF